MPLLTLFKGLVIGIVIALPVGPVGFLCVRRTLFEGPAYGLVSGLGAATADAIFGSIAGFGLTFVRTSFLAYENWLAVLGGLMLLYLGLKALIRPGPLAVEPLRGEAIIGAYASTFALTITNPITILAFAAIFAKFGVDGSARLFDIGVLVAGVFTGSLLWWLGLSFGIVRLQRVVGGRLATAWLGRVTGAILSLSGGALLIAGVFGLVVAH